MRILDDIRVKAAWLYEDSSMKKVIRACFSDGTLSMVLYRSMACANQYALLKPLAMVLSKFNSLLCGAVIGTGAKFGERFVILHSCGIVINSRVKGGNDIMLESGVVIGEEKRVCPILGDNIFVGSGAKIIGAVTIGNNVTIGANAVVVKDIPSNVTAGGVPAKILRFKTPPEDQLND
jgi:serine O-acetyltransferase